MSESQFAKALVVIMSVLRISIFLISVISINIVFYIYDLIDVIFQESLPEVRYETYDFEEIKPRVINSCLNPTVYATTPFAFVSMLSVFAGVENDLPNYIESSKKLGMSIRRFTNLDLILMVPVNKNEYEQLTWIGHRIWWDELERASWKVCVVPVIDVADKSLQDIRFYKAKLFSKLNAWNLVWPLGICCQECHWTFCFRDSCSDAIFMRQISCTKLI